MRKVLPMTEIAPMIEKAFEDGKEFNLITAGTSMLPMLRDRKDTVVLRKVDGKLKKYDLPLYKRADGSFVLHRIVGKGKEGYRMSGDNQLAIEYPVTDGQIVAVVSAYIKDGKRTSVNSIAYKFYCFWHCNAVKPIRSLKQKLRQAVKR